MADNKKLSKLRLAVICTALAAGLGTAATAAASDVALSEKDMILQAVSLYEKLSGDEVEVPDALIESCGDVSLGKAVVLGFANADEISSISDSTALRKQDAMTVLYKTIIDYDDSFALSSDEVDEIMNRCYDNTLVDERNRVGYAFMLKHGIISSGKNTEPNKPVTWESCRILVDVLYDAFMQEVTFDVNGTAVQIGANISTVTDVLGEPSRIEKSDYPFDWYVYNKDYNSFMMVGVLEGRICAFYSNCGSFGFDTVRSGDDYLSAFGYINNGCYKLYKDADDKLDAVMYNPYCKEDSGLSDAAARTCELADMINARRAKLGFPAVKISPEMLTETFEMSSQPKYIEAAGKFGLEHDMDGAAHERGYDVCSIYAKLTAENNDCFSPAARAVGLGSAVMDDSMIVASVKSTNSADGAIEIDPDSVYRFVPQDETAEETDTAASAAETAAEEAAAGALQIASPTSESVIAAGEELKIELLRSVADEYFVQIYSIEDDEYIVNSCFKTTGTELSFDAALFEAGKDYSVRICAANSADTAELIVRCGEAPENSVSVITPEQLEVSDDDCIDVSWESEMYHDFVVDVYDEDGQLRISQPVTDAKSLRLTNVDPGHYYIYISAMRRGSTDVIKAQCMTEIQIELPEPVITEYLLDDGERFYPVYEDKDMGLVYFYDEDIVDIDTLTPDGKTVTVKKKKITEKQIKATEAYKALADTQRRVEYFEGGTELALKKEKEFVQAAPGDLWLHAYSSEFGYAVVKEAESYLGVPYVWGGMSPSGFDCSGLVKYVYGSLGVNISRVSQTQFLEGTPVTREQLLPGDLVFFSENGDVHHVGIYVGNGMMIHAPHTGAVVEYQSIDTPYYASQFCGGRRFNPEVE